MVDLVNRQAREALRIRGHHFLCLLTYKGLGYTPAFVENLSRVAEAINAGQRVMLVSGPDDICEALSAHDRTACNHDCAKPDTLRIDELAIHAVAPTIGSGMTEPFTLTATMVAKLRGEFAKGSIRAACRDCRWRDICDDIAAQDFDGVRLFPQG
jgi:uncharacterized protein